VIKFKFISYRNFFSIGAAAIKIDLDNNTNTIIVGQNGAGKSTFVSAICYALYGKPYKDVLKGGIVNSINKKDLLVEIDFEIGQDQYKIRRGMKPNIFEIYLNGNLLNVDALGIDYQTHLEKNILKIKFHTFKQMIVIGNSGFTPFLKLPAGQRREMIEDILDLGVFSKMNIILKEELKTLRDERNSLEKKIFQLSVQITSETDKLNFMIEKSKQEDNGRKVEIENTIAEKEKSLAKIPADLPDHQEEGNQLASNMKKFEAKENQIYAATGYLKGELEFLKHDACPTCKQGIPHDHKATVEKNVNDEIAKHDEMLGKLKKAKSNLETQISKIIEKIDKVNQLVRVRERLEFEVKTLRGELVALSSKKVDFDQKGMETTIEKLEADKSESDNVLINLQNKELTILQALDVLKDNGVKSKIIRTYIPIINQFINEYLEMLNFYVSFEIDENFDETIKSRYRDVFKYDNFSDGEKSRIDLAFLFTWRKISTLRNGISTNLLILDEVFSGSLDSAGIEDLNLILKGFGGISVFVITHRLEGTIEKFENVIKFEKVNNFTQISRDTDNDISIN
jgi:DNA repair exonuclease SbcCD ATPase subunit